MDEERKYEKIVKDLYDWWEKYKTTSKVPVSTRDVNLSLIPSGLLTDLAGININSDFSLQQILDYKFTGNLSSVKKYVDSIVSNSEANIQKSLSNRPTPNIQYNIDHGIIDSSAISQLKRSYNQKISELDKIIAKLPKGSSEYKHAFDERNNLRNSINEVGDIEKIIFTSGQPYFRDQVAKRLEDSKTEVVRILRSEGIPVSSTDPVEVVIQKGKLSKNPETLGKLSNLVYFAGNNSLKTGNRVLSTLSDFYKIPKPPGLDKKDLKIQEIVEISKEKFRPNFKDFSSKQTQKELIKTLLDKNPLYTEIEINEILSDPQSEIDFNDYITEFKGLIAAKNIGEIKKRVEVSKSPKEMVLRQVARKALANERWYGRTAKTSSIEPAILVERSALETDQTASILPGAAEVLATNGGLDSSGFMTIDTLNALPDEKRKFICRTLESKFISHELSGRLSEVLSSGHLVASKNGLSLYTLGSKTDPRYKDRTITLGKLMSRTVSEELSAQITENYLEQRDANAGNLEEARRSHASFWKKRGENADFTDTVKRAVEKSIIEMNPDKYKAGILDPETIELVKETTETYERLFKTTLTKNPGFLTPVTDFHVELPTGLEHTSQGTVIRLTETSPGIPSDFNINSKGNQPVYVSTTVDYLQVPNKRSVDDALVEIGGVIEEAKERVKYYQDLEDIEKANKQTPVLMSSTMEGRAEEFNKNLEFTLSALFHPEMYKAKRKKDSDEFLRNSYVSLIENVFGKSEAQDLLKLLNTKDLVGLYGGILKSKNPSKELTNLLWEKGLEGTSIFKGGLKGIISRRITGALRLRRVMDVGGGHIAEVNIITQGILKIKDRVTEWLIGGKLGNFCGWNKNFSFEKRTKKKPFLLTLVTFAVTTVFNIIKSTIKKVADIAGKSRNLLKVKNAILSSRPVVYLLNTRLGGFIVSKLSQLKNVSSLISQSWLGRTVAGVVDKFKVLRHFGRAGFSFIQGSIIGGLLGTIVGGPVGGVIGAVSFGGDAFFKSLRNNRFFEKDLVNSIVRNSADSRWGKFLNSVGTIVFKNRLISAGMISGNSFLSRLGQTLTNAEKLANGFRYFKNATAIGMIATVFGASPLVAIAVGVGAVALEIGVGRLLTIAKVAASPYVLGISRITSLISKSIAFQVISRFPIFESLGFGVAFNYFLEEAKILGKLLRNEITMQEYIAHLVDLGNIVSFGLASVGLVTSTLAITSFITNTLAPYLTRLASVPGVGMKVFFSGAVGATVAGGIAALLGLSAPAVILAASIGAAFSIIGLFGGWAIGGPIGGFFGLVSFTGLGAVVGNFFGNLLDRGGMAVAQFLGALSAMLGLYKLFKARSFTDFVQSALLFSFSLTVVGTLGLTFLTAIPAIYSTGLFDSAKTIVNVSKSYNTLVDNQTLQYTIILTPGSKGQKFTNLNVSLTDTIVNPNDLSSITTVGNPSPGFSIKNDTIDYQFIGLFQNFNTEKLTYLVHLKKPITEVAANSNFCNMIKGTVAATELTDEVGPQGPGSRITTTNFDQTVCVDKNGKLVRGSEKSRLYRPDLGGLPIDPKESGVAVTQCSYGGFSHTYRALDIGAPEGTAIFAWESGTVIKIEKYFATKKSGGYGTFVRLEHDVNGKKYQTLYAHMLPNVNEFVNVGDTVIKGQQIGEVGKTGNSTGFHIHFEIREVVNKTNIEREPCCHISCYSYNSSIANSCTDIRSSYYSNPKYYNCN